MTNHIILASLSVVYVYLCVCCIIEFQRRSANKTKSVYLPKSMLWIGAAGGVVFLLIGWIAAVQDSSLGLTICFGLFVMLSMSLMTGWKNCYISYDKTGFTQKNFIGMQRHFTYDQVSAWCLNRSNPMESSLYAAGKKISFNFMSEEGSDFLIAVSTGYRKTHGNNNLPDMRKVEKEGGGFRAHVHNPEEYLLVFLMIFAFIVGSGLWIVIDCLQPIDENDSQKFSLTFSDWDIDGHSVILISPQVQEPFRISGYEDYLDGFDQLTEKCDSNTIFSVWAERFDPDDSDPYYWVYAISSEGEVYRTFEDSTAYKRQEIPLIIGLFSIFLVILFAFSAFIYIVGSNPHKFPKWVVYLCFKEHAIDM